MSPDKVLEAYLRTGVTSRDKGANVFLVNTKTGETMTLLTGTSSSWSPTWSPDGRYVAFVSDRDATGKARVWIWEAAKRVSRKVSDVDVRMLGEQYIEWTSDSRHVLVPTIPEGISFEEFGKKFQSLSSEQERGIAKEPGSTVRLFRSSATEQTNKEPISDAWSLESYTQGIALIDIASGKARFVVSSEKIGRYKISPDGSNLALTIMRRFEKASSQQILFDLTVVNLSTMKQTTLASDIRLDYVGDFNWSPDGKQLAYRMGGVEERIRDCYVVSIGGNLRNVTKFLSDETSHRLSPTPLWETEDRIWLIRHGALWRASLHEDKAVHVSEIPHHRIVRMISYSTGRVWLTGGDGFIVVIAHDDVSKLDGFYKIDLRNGQNVRLLEDGRCYVFCTATAITPTVDGKNVAYLAEDAGHASDIWFNDADFSRPRRLTSLNPQVDKYRMGKVQLIDWLGDDGKRLQGALLLPANYQSGKRYPLIVWVYGGGMLSESFNHFGLVSSGPFNMQLFATRDYAVLLPDSPQQVGTPMLDLAKTVLPGVNKIVDMGVADPDQIGVMGHSNGGYSTLSLIVETTRFRAAISMDGTGDLVGLYGEMNKDGTTYGIANLEHGQNAMGGTLWQFPERYIKNSPIFYLDRVATPLLIVHGSDDRGVASFLGDQVFVGLRRLGKEVEYAKYEGEGHVPPNWSYPNQVDLCNRMIAWFDEHLKKPEDKAGADKQKPN